MGGGVKNVGSSGQMPYGMGDIGFINRTTEILDQIPLAGGKMGGIAEHVDSLRKEFKSLPPHMKEFMYRQLTEDDGSLKTKFAKIPPPDSDDLLKILNSKHIPKRSEAYNMQVLHDQMKEFEKVSKEYERNKELEKRKAEEAGLKFQLDQELNKNDQRRINDLKK